MDHFYTSIPGWFWWEELYSKIVENALNSAHFVEVGAWLGKSSSYLAVEIINSGKSIKLDCVDTWQGSIDAADTGIFDKYFREHNNDLDAAYTEFLNYTEPVKEIITPIRMDSVSASKLYADESLDFVFIDANHEYPFVTADIKAWYPKVKIGGVIAGDDFGKPTGGVGRAVAELFQDFRIDVYRWVVTKANKWLT